MSPERLYDDDEVGEIFHRATEDVPSPSSLPVSRSSARGLNLRELQEIGAEAGIEPARVARAAASLERSGDPSGRGRRRFGVTVSAHHVVHLPERLDDVHWDRLVVRMRELFQARGEVRSEGTLRSWSNGNLQILQEPTADGCRLRMETVSSKAVESLGVGVGLAGTGIVSAAGFGLASVLGLGVSPAEFAVMGGLLSAIAVSGGVLHWFGRRRAARWVPEREAQFAELGVLARELAEDQSSPDRMLPEGSHAAGSDE